MDLGHFIEYLALANPSPPSLVSAMQLRRDSTCWSIIVCAGEGQMHRMNANDAETRVSSVQADMLSRGIGRVNVV